MDICSGGPSIATATTATALTIQVNDPGQQDVVSQPSGTVIVNCYKDAIESESGVCIKVIQNEDANNQVGEEKKCNANCNTVNSAKNSRSTQCEDQLFAKDKEISDCAKVKVNDHPVPSEISDDGPDAINASVTCSPLNNSASSAASSTTICSATATNQIESDISKDTSSSRPKSFRSTEAQTDNHFLQPNQITISADTNTSSATAVSATMPTEVSTTATTTAAVSGQTREERRRERRERRQHRALQAGRHCHPNQRVQPGNGAVPPYEILPDLVSNQHHHLLPPPYSTLPMGSTMVGHPPPIVPRLPAPPGHHHPHHHHHHHMALQRIRSTSPPPPVPGSILIQAPPPPVPILQPVPVASIATAVGEDPRFLFQLPVIRR